MAIDSPYSLAPDTPSRRRDEWTLAFSLAVSLACNAVLVACVSTMLPEPEDYAFILVAPSGMVAQTLEAVDDAPGDAVLPPAKPIPEVDESRFPELLPYSPTAIRPTPPAPAIRSEASRLEPRGFDAPETPLDAPLRSTLPARRAPPPERPAETPASPELPPPDPPPIPASSHTAAPVRPEERFDTMADTVATRGEKGMESAATLVSIPGMAIYEPAADETARFADQEQPPPPRPRRTVRTRGAPTEPTASEPADVLGLSEPVVEESAEEEAFDDEPEENPVDAWFAGAESYEPSPPPIETSRPTRAVAAAPPRQGLTRSAQPADSRSRMRPASPGLRPEPGVAVVSVRISETGVCLWAELTRSSGYPELDRAALEAARRAAYRPAYIAGLPVTSTEAFEVRF